MRTLDQLISFDITPFLKDIDAKYADWWEHHYDLGKFEALEQSQKTLMDALPKFKALRIDNYTEFDFVDWKIDNYIDMPTSLEVSYKPKDIAVSFWTAPLNRVEIE